VFDNTGKIIGIDKTADWVAIDFERYTGFLIQEKRVVGRNVIVNQKVYFEKDDITQDALEALKALNESGCLNVIVQDNNGLFHYCGISKGHSANTWHQQDMRTNEGKANSNAENDETGVVLAETIECLTYNYAPLTSHPSVVPTSVNVIYHTGSFAFVTPNNSVFIL
jgi:hypothetical protein